MSRAGRRCCSAKSSSIFQSAIYPLVSCPMKFLFLVPRSHRHRCKRVMPSPLNRNVGSVYRPHRAHCAVPSMCMTTMNANSLEVARYWGALWYLTDIPVMSGRLSVLSFRGIVCQTHECAQTNARFALRTCLRTGGAQNSGSNL